MKRLKVKDAGQCKACLQCAVSCASAFYKDYDVSKSCIQITEKPDKTIAVRSCIQCGKCARNCEAGAISQNAKGVYMINKKLCVHSASLQVHRLRHLRQGLPHGDPGGRGKLSFSLN